MKIQRIILLFIAIISLVTVFLYDIIRRVVTDVAEKGGDIIHTGLILIGFGCIAAYVVLRQRQVEINPVKTVGKITIISLGLITLMGIITLSSIGTFYYEDGSFIPKNYGTLIIASILSVAAGISAIIVFIEFSDLIFVKRRRYTKRNFIILLIVGGLYLLSSFFISEGQDNGSVLPSAVSTFLLILLIFSFFLNSFRLSWIVYLSRREKLFSLLFSFFGLVFSTMAAVFSHESSNLLNQSLIYYHQSLFTLVSSVYLFSAIYMGITFATTLFQLPTAEAFDRKKVEISSLHNMSRLITQVLDYDELIATTINLSLSVSEGNAAWLVLFPDQTSSSNNHPNGFIPNHIPQSKQVESKNIEKYGIDGLQLSNGEALYSIVLSSNKPLIIHDFANDKRVRHLKNHRKNIGSLAMFPLISHDSMIGVLSIIKNIPYGFDRDIVHVLLAFTDLVTVAIDNNKLIGQSIVKERLEQELMVAQQMQQKLLPQQLPEIPEFEMSAISLPAYEVGGDYYDVVQLPHNRIGIVIGDVSGKGVSAAMYMAQVKGVFQSLCMQSETTRDLLIKTNTALYGNMERKSFVSLLYTIIDIESETLTYSRAGHCPPLYLRDETTSYLRPAGMGLGLDRTARFSESIEEEQIKLQTNDLIILYTDGITEAKNRAGEEYGYKRLSDLVAHAKYTPPNELMHQIIREVKSFTDGGVAEDDITVLVLRWRGKEKEHEHARVPIQFNNPVISSC